MMFAYLEGRLVTKAPTHVVLDVNGVGYEVRIPLSSYNRLAEKNNKVRILTYFYVREDIQQLYGFITEKEKDFFKILLTVSGVGPRMALAILSGSSHTEIKRAICKGDSAFLKSIPGIGRKLAERIIVELKEKISVEEDWMSKSERHRKKENEILFQDCIHALISLGYRHSIARNALHKALSSNSSSLTAEELIKESLNYVSEK
jgi:Holliday junction DNA helicase RuvA